MHLFVWGSILAWFAVIPFMSAQAVYTGFLPLFTFYGGVAAEVLGSATFWFYWPLAVMLALSPTIISRIIRLDFDPHLVDDVRLLQKKEGRSIFKRVKFHRKPPSPLLRRASTVRRTGYAFAQEEGYGRMISSGKMFGMNEEEVQSKHEKRLSRMVSNPSTPTHTSAPQLIAAAVEASLTLVGSVSLSVEPQEKTMNVDVYEPSSPVEEVPQTNLSATKEEDVEEIKMEAEHEVGAQDSVGISVRVNLPGSVQSSPEVEVSNQEVTTGRTGNEAR